MGKETAKESEIARTGRKRKKTRRIMILFYKLRTEHIKNNK